MASVVTRSGVQAEVGRPTIVDGEIISKTRDLIIIRLRKQGLSFAAIGGVLNIAKSTVCERYYDIPENVRSYYATVPMG